jgi:hypothetical protein
MKYKLSIVIAALIFNGAAGLKAQIATVPFELIGPHLYIKVQTSHSDSLNFIFDTGATGGTIDSLTAEKAGLSLNRKTVSVAGSGGVKTFTMAEHQSLKMNNFEVKNVNLVLANLSSLSADLGTRLDGIVGYEILNQYVTRIDFDQKKMSFYKDIRAIDTSGYTSIPFEFNKNVLIPRFPITITLDNGESFTGRVMFDTGNAFPLLVSTPFSKYHNFDQKLGISSEEGGRGMHSVTRDKLANITSMSFNGFRFGKMGVRLTINDQAEPRDGYLGILGIEVIKRFNVILDYAEKKIYLKPNHMYHESFALSVFRGTLDTASISFLDRNKTKSGVHVTASGLQYQVIREGKGPIPTITDRVSLHYKTTLLDGKKLWSTYDHQKPWVHHLDKTIEGVREAVLMMPAGSKWKLFVPASLAFGDSGNEDVAPGAALIYEVEVLNSEQ